jgi:hypothetical protein
MGDKPVIIRRNRIRNPSWISIRIYHPNGWDIIQSTLMQQNIILQRIHHNHQIRLQRLPLRNLLIKTRDNFVVFTHCLNLTIPKDLVSIRDTPWCPALKEMTSFC